MAEPFLISPFFLDFVLPFILVFTVVFAVLQKSQVLGEDKKQVDAMVGLVVGLMLIAFPGARSIVVLLMPFLAISIVLLLVFMLLLGFIKGTKDGNVLGDAWKNSLAAILFIALVVYLLKISGYWDYFFSGQLFGGGSIFVNVLLILIIVGAMVAVLKGGGGSSGGG